ARIPTALAGDSDVLYALGGPGLEVALGAPEGTLPGGGVGVVRSTLYRLRDPDAAAWGWDPIAGWQPGTGSWEVVGPVPAPFRHCQRATLAPDGQLYVSDDAGGRSVVFKGVTATPGLVLRYDPARSVWIRYPSPPTSLYGLDEESRLVLIEGSAAGPGPVDVPGGEGGSEPGVEGQGQGPLTVASDQPVGGGGARFHGGCEADPEGNLYWYLEPSPGTNLLPTLYSFEPAPFSKRPDEQDGVWKLAAFPVDQVYDGSGTLVTASPSLVDLTVAPGGDLVLGYVSYANNGIGEGFPTFYEYPTAPRAEQPGRPRIPPLPGLTATFDPGAPGLTRWDPAPPSTNLGLVGSGGVRQAGQFDYRPTAFYSR
ncbi:MAG: hypothetical protein AB1758_29325, partial [Candidatus Eremiobacterota bacterium]